jgi:hypothetical protein
VHGIVLGGDNRQSIGKFGFVRMTEALSITGG